MRLPRFGRLLLAALCLGLSAFAAAADPAKVESNDAGQRLAAKLVELEALQREVDQLRLELGRQPQILFAIKTVEVNLTGMKNLGIDFSKFHPLEHGERANAAPNLADAEQAEILFGNPGFLDALIRWNSARIVSDPRLVTVSGRPVHFHQGGESPVAVGPNGKVETRKLGTEIELLGTVTATNTIQLKVKASNSELDQANPVVVKGQKQPGLRVQAIDTSLELKSGETRCLMGPVHERTEVSLRDGGIKTSHAVRVQTIWLVAAELVDPESADASVVRTDGQQSPHPAARTESADAEAN